MQKLQILHSKIVADYLPQITQQNAPGYISERQDLFSMCPLAVDLLYEQLDSSLEEKVPVINQQKISYEPRNKT